MCIKMMYNIITFKNIFQYQTEISTMQKLQLLLHQPNTLKSEILRIGKFEEKVH